MWGKNKYEVRSIKYEVLGIKYQVLSKKYQFFIAIFLLFLFACNNVKIDDQDKIDNQDKSSKTIDYAYGYLSKDSATFISFSDLAQYNKEGLDSVSYLYLSEEKMRTFMVYPFDNGPDYLSEGLFRILNNQGKIGYADTVGNIIVEPMYTCAKPFENGKAEVALEGQRNVSTSDGEHSMWGCTNWFFIDKEGKRINE